MKKFVVGCGVVILIGLAVFGFIAYEAFQGVQSMVAELGTIQENLTATNRRYPFTPPVDGLISETRFGDYLAVRLPVAKTAKAALTELQSNKQGLKILKNIKDLIGRPGNALISSLNERKMSSAEYRFISGQMIGTLESGDARARPEAKPLIRAYDQLKNSAMQWTQQSQLSISDLALPVTAGQIRHNMDLMLPKEQQIIDSMPALLADAIVSGMAQPPASAPASGPASGPSTEPASTLTTVPAAYGLSSHYPF